MASSSEQEIKLVVPNSEQKCRRKNWWCLARSNKYRSKNWWRPARNKKVGKLVGSSSEQNMSKQKYVLLVLQVKQFNYFILYKLSPFFCRIFDSLGDNNIYYYMQTPHVSDISNADTQTDVSNK